ncbi:Hcp family type VI secretion system effector [Hyphomonas sp.]|uniref:Hcp family type VI secretion system effector n=1 Tax=Hyphomonas sp. TaxID=87 RepID=UPI00391C50E6
MIRKTLLALFAAMIATALPALAAGYLKLGDIKGESTDARHKDWITIESLAEGIDVPTSAAAGGGSARAGKVQVRPIVITKATDSTTPQIRQAALTGKVLKDATIEVEGLTVTLKNVTVTSASSQTVSGKQVEEVVLVASEISWAAKAPGGAAVSATFNSKTGTP